MDGDRARHPKDLVTGGRIKKFRQLERTLDAAQDRADFLDQPECERAGLHPAADLDEKGIAHLIAKPCERMADRRRGFSSFLAAPATLPSTISASNTTSRFRPMRCS